MDVAVFISNCKNAGGQNRLKYVKEMMEYIPMHSYGGCLGNRKEQEIPYDDRWPKHDQRRARKHKTLRQYKFYLAFENTGVRVARLEASPDLPVQDDDGAVIHSS